jgi:hypothetical protein
MAGEHLKFVGGCEEFRGPPASGGAIGGAGDAIGARLGDRWGRRRAFTIGLLALLAAPRLIPESRAPGLHT